MSILPSPFRPFFLATITLTVMGSGVSAAPCHAQAVGEGSARAAADSINSVISEASLRFGVPEAWIRAVMRVESAGDVTAVSHKGAMGLMQVMPGTYAELRARHGLGTDPFDVRNNVLAGTAYLRELFDRYGSPGFLAAYNAGPGRWEQHAFGGRPLPRETVDYLARLTPRLEIVTTSEPDPKPPERVPSPYESPLFVRSASIEAAADPLVENTTGPDQSAERQPSNGSPSALFSRGFTGASASVPPASTDVPAVFQASPSARSSVPRSIDPPQSSSLFVARSGSRSLP